MEEENKIEYPDNVTNKEAYKQYLELLTNPIRLENKIILSTGEEINLSLPLSKIQRSIIGLSKEEQKIVKDKYKLIVSLTGSMGKFKEKAFAPIIKIEDGVEVKKTRSVLEPKANEIRELFGRFYTLKEVHKIILEEFKIDISLESLNNFRRDNIEFINERQNINKKDFSDIRLTWQRGRIEELAALYVKAKHKWEVSQSRDDYKILLLTIEQIRKEVEGDKLTINGKVQMDIEHTIKIQTQTAILNELALKDIVLARVAGKIGINPLLLISKLHNSIYSKFTQYGEEWLKDDEPIYPSSQTYDFDKIKAAQENITREAKDLESKFSFTLPVAEVEVVKDKKQILIDLLNKKKIELEKSKAIIDISNE